MKGRSLQQSNRGVLEYFKKSQNVAISIICVIFFLIQGFGSIKQFLKEETGTRSYYLPMNDIDFPDFMICPNELYITKNLQSNGINSKKEYIYDTKWSSNDTTKTAEDLYHDITIDILKVVENITVRIKTPFNGSSEIFVGNMGKNISLGNIFSFEDHYKFGRCIKFTMPSWIVKAFPHRVLFLFNKDVTIFPHQRNQFQNRDFRQALQVNNSYELEYSIIKRLKGCKEISNFDHCIIKNIQDFMMKNIGCTVPWLPNKSQICTNQSLKKEAFKYYRENIENIGNICQKPCQVMKVSADILQNIVIRKQIIIIHFKSEVMVLEDYFLQTPLDLLANIGGYIGLFLGVSLIQLKHVISSTIDLISKCFKF